jgi:hypothetical protein
VKIEMYLHFWKVKVNEKTKNCSIKKPIFFSALLLLIAHGSGVQPFFEKEKS